MKTKKTKTTISDVARKAGVSYGTVSRVLNGKYIRCQPDTRKRILKIAEELKYRPNLLARALQSQTYHTIGILGRDITDAFFVEIIGAIEAYLTKTNYRGIWLSAVHYASENRETLLEEIRGLPIDGLIVSELESLISDAQLLQLHGRDQMRISTIIRKTGGGHLSSVTLDTAMGVKLLLDYLADLGHREFGFCYGPESLEGSVIRFQTFTRLLEERNLPVIREWFCPSEGTTEGGFRATKQILTCTKKPTAIIAHNDLVAFGCIRACMENGFSVPRQISVAGFDNLRMSALFYPSLTTTAIDYELLAKSAIDQTIAMIEGNWELFRAEHHVIQPELVVRESTRPPPH